MIINRQIFTKNFANYLSGEIYSIAISKSALWRATSSLFWENRSYGNDPMAYGIISLFWWKSEFDSVITSQICVFWGVPHFSGCMYDHQIWLSCMQTMHDHHILASCCIIKYDHSIWSSRCIIMVYGCILLSNFNIIDYLLHFQEYFIFHIRHHVLSPSVA